MENIKLTPKRKEIIERMGFSDINSILRYYPYRYDRYSNDTLSMEKHDTKVSFEGKIATKPKIEYLPKKLMKTSFVLKNDNFDVNIVMFNHFVNTNFLYEGNNLVVIGKYNAFSNEISVSNFFVGTLDGKIKYNPIYSLPQDIKDNTYRTFIKYIIEQNNIHNYVNNVIPEDFILKYKLININKALEYIHIPGSDELLHQAHRYLKYEEFLNFCGIGYLKRKLFQEGKPKNKKIIDFKLVNDFINDLPFKLTDDQINVKNEILDDIKSNINMSRLLQGDVGSGKTIVATIAALANVSASYQSAIMAPTDILARQHYYELTKLLSKYNIKIALLVSDLKPQIKNQTLDDIENGNVDIIIGTHALISSNVKFKKLGLAVIDEQHRFGVKQRVALKNKGIDIDVLYMSATPIPRTLASTIYMDMDVSTISTYPYKKRKVKTYYLQSNSIFKIKDFINQYLKTNKQIYIVCPSINESQLDIETVTSIYDKWKQEFSNYNIALLHGKLKNDIKDNIMNDFKDGKINILVSTTVIEVGINVFGANMMIIYNAERFGLAQIHQLRGRIARDGSNGYCYLLSDSEDIQVIERLTFMQDNDDGFKISMYDLSRRGAGDMLGLVQSGKSPFVIANLIDDFNILNTAAKDIRYIMAHTEKYKDYIDYLESIIKNSPKYVD